MMLHNPMEDKQLNFYQPLLSVRRSSSTTTALAEAERRKPSNPPPSIPPLPYYKSELKSGPVTNPGVVPFNWERIPGRPKNDRKLQNNVLNQPPPAPKLPPGRVVSTTDENSSDKLVKDREENGSSHSEGESSTYLDALDMLSRSDSLFFNCSLSGVSGLDSPGSKSSGLFLDQQTRDFMMGRFLPAAKAVASETTHFGSRKQTAKKEQTREVKKVVLSDKQNPRYYYTPTSLPQHQEDVDESEEEDDEHVGTETVSTILCSLLPRFCMLNSIPGMRDETVLPLPSVHKAPKKCSDESDPGIYEYNKSEKAIRDAVFERRRLAIYQKSDTRVEVGHLKDELEKCNQQNASLKLDELPHIQTLYHIDSAQIKEDRDTNSSSSESTTNIPLFQVVVLNQEVQKENGMTSSVQSIKLADVDAKKHSKRDLHQNLAPPLPKSPSESWLSRALPSMSTKHTTYLSTKNLALKPSPAKPKWEDVVKCSSLHTNNFGLALTPISEN